MKGMVLGLVVAALAAGCGGGSGGGGDVTAAARDTGMVDPTCFKQGLVNLAGDQADYYACMGLNNDEVGNHTVTICFARSHSGDWYDVTDKVDFC